jgi:hypothetical protein
MALIATHNHRHDITIMMTTYKLVILGGVLCIYNYAVSTPSIRRKRDGRDVYWLGCYVDRRSIVIMDLVLHLRAYMVCVGFVCVWEYY